MDNKDDDSNINIDNNGKDADNNQNVSDDSGRQQGQFGPANPLGTPGPTSPLSPTGSSVVQGSQKPGIQENLTNSKVEDIVSEEGLFPGSESIEGTSVEGVGKIGGPTTTTTSKTYSKTTTNGNVTETTTKGTTASTTSSTSSNPKLDEMLANTQKVSNLVQSLNTARNNAVELSINYEELIYFQRMVRPLIDSTYFMALSAQGSAIATQALNSINFAKPKQVEFGVDVTYNFLKELDCLLEVLKCRLDTYLTLVENDGCNAP